MNAKDLPTGSKAGIDQDWIKLACALTPKLDAAGPQIDRDMALPKPILDALHDAKMFRMLLPRSQGGAELDLPTFFQVVHAIAEGDASAGWTVSQSNGCAMSAAYLAPEAANEVFGPAHAVLAWGFPHGPCRATPVDGGWRVTGNWGFGSGNRHATWLGGHCQVTDAQGVPLTKPSGAPIERTALFPRSAVTIKDGQWNVIGLRGTGSDTYSVQDLFVPATHCIIPRAVGRDQQRPEDEVLEVEVERREQGTLYHFSPTIVYQAGFSAVALGVARSMLNSFIELAMKKTPSGGTTLLRDNAVIQEHVAVSQARLESLRVWIRQTLADAWAHCQVHRTHGFEYRVTMRLASTYAMREAAKVAESVYADAGATAIFENQPFERRLRDMHAVAQQVQASSSHLQTAGQYYLGLKPSSRFI